MKIVACVKAVPDAVGGRRIDAATGRLDRARRPRALGLRPPPRRGGAADPRGGRRGRGRGVSLGPAGAADALRKTLAMGADRSVLVSDEAFAGADLRHDGARARGRARARAAPSSSCSASSRPTATAPASGRPSPSCSRRPVISQVAELVGRAGRRRRAGARPSSATSGSARRCRPSSPSRMRSTSRAIRSLKGIMGAKTKPQETLSAAEVGGADRRGTTVLRSPAAVARRARRRRGRRRGPEAIVEFLVERRLL